jgi:tRNA A37 threonylcarbamoyladenosine biosynthesis protein TsaE
MTGLTGTGKTSYARAVVKKAARQNRSQTTSCTYTILQSPKSPSP